MNDEEKKGADLETLQTKLSEMSQEDVAEFALKEAKARGDQEKFNQKLKDEIKALKDSPVKEEEPKEAKVEVAPTAPTMTMEDTVVISKLTEQGYTLDEIKQAKSLVGTALGADMNTVANSAGFKAQRDEQRELSKSSEMQIDNLQGIQGPTTDTQFLKQADDGLLDLSNPTHRERFKNLKVKEMRVGKK